MATLGFPVTAASGPAPQVDDLEYTVGVSAHLVPFYAEDKDGNPVYDLKQEEIQLRVNKKSFPMMSLSSFRLYFVLIDPKTTTCLFNWVK